ncbi:MAG: hypothetical protein LBK99_24040, partial [Opitutaceae bacterium]|nr:hypothetical protein [Opitutaceae bacterium]
GFQPVSVASPLRSGTGLLPVDGAKRRLPASPFASPLPSATPLPERAFGRKSPRYSDPAASPSHGLEARATSERRGNAHGLEARATVLCLSRF